MNNFNIEFINSSKCTAICDGVINGELWCKAEPVAEPYFPKPEFGEPYYYIGANGKIMRPLWTDDNIDEYRYHTLNCWLNKSEAEAYVARYGIYLPDRLTLAIRRWKIANGVEDRFEWNSDDNKCCFFYDYHKQKWRYDWCQTHRRPAVEYFPNAETIEKCLNDLQEYFDDQLIEWNAESEGE